MRRKLEEAKEELSRKELPAEKNIGQQKPNEPEGEPKGSRNRREKSEGYAATEALGFEASDRRAANTPRRAFIVPDELESLRDSGPGPGAHR